MKMKRKDALALAEQIIRNVDELSRSSHMLVIGPEAGTSDYLIAMQIGYSILMDKPMIVLAPEGRHVGERLLRIADHVVTCDITNEKGLAEATKRLGLLLNQ